MTINESNFSTPPSENPNPPINNPAPTPAPPSSPASPQKPIISDNKQKIEEIEKIKSSIVSGKTTDFSAKNNPTNSNSPAKQNIGLVYKLLANKKFIIGFILIIILIIAGIITYNYFVKNIGKLSIKFDQTPDTLTIDGQDYLYTIGQEITLKPGTYNVSATKTNYYPFQSSISITPEKTTFLDLKLTSYPTPYELVKYTSSFPHLNPPETEISYLSNFGTTFYKKIINTEESNSTNNHFNHILDVIWAPSNRTACIIKAQNNPTLHTYQDKNILFQKDKPLDSILTYMFDFSRYDLVSQNLLLFPSTINNPTWHPEKEEIIFQYIDPATGENSLSKSKPNLENKELLIDLENTKNALVKYSPDTEMIAILDLDQTTAVQSNPIYLFYTVSRNFEKIPTKDIYIDFKWSPDSTKIVALKNNQSLSIIDINSMISIDLNIKATINNIAWLHNSPKLIISSADIGKTADLLIYDLNTNQSESVPYIVDKPFNNITNLITNYNDSTLYFVGDEHIYSLDLQTQLS